MSDDISARLSLPLLRAGQAQKEITHNEALTLADMLIQASVIEAGIATPPIDPNPGDCWIVATAARGAWAGHDNSLAGWTEGGWRFVDPTEGTTVWCAADATFRTYDGVHWSAGELRGAKFVVQGQQVVGARGVSIIDPIGGATLDAEARTAIIAILSGLRAHGLIAS